MKNSLFIFEAYLKLPEKYLENHGKTMEKPWTIKKEQIRLDLLFYHLSSEHIRLRF